MKKLLIIYNSNDKFSRSFAAANAGECDLLDWYNDAEGQKAYADSGMPHPSSFPCIADRDSKFCTGLVLSVEDGKRKLAELACDPEKMYTLNRLSMYQQAGLDESAWMRAIIQKEVDGDPTEYNRLITKRAEVKALIPKPVNKIPTE